jgi:hypothetical protein
MVVLVRQQPNVLAVHTLAHVMMLTPVYCVKHRYVCSHMLHLNIFSALIYSEQLNPDSRYCYAMDRSAIPKTQANAANFCAAAVPGAKLATINDAADLVDLVSTLYNLSLFIKVIHYSISCNDWQQIFHNNN